MALRSCGKYGMTNLTGDLSRMLWFLSCDTLKQLKYFWHCTRNLPTSNGISPTWTRVMFCSRLACSFSLSSAPLSFFRSPALALREAKKIVSHVLTASISIWHSWRGTWVRTYLFQSLQLIIQARNLLVGFNIGFLSSNNARLLCLWRFLRNSKLFLEVSVCLQLIMLEQ